jgi:hypothetical protein
MAHQSSKKSMDCDKDIPVAAREGAATDYRRTENERQSKVYAAVLKEPTEKERDRILPNSGMENGLAYLRNLASL